MSRDNLHTQMNYDVNLQRAIYESIRSTKPSAGSSSGSGHFNARNVSRAPPFAVSSSHDRQPLSRPARLQPTLPSHSRPSYAAPSTTSHALSAPIRATASSKSVSSKSVNRRGVQPTPSSSSSSSSSASSASALRPNEVGLSAEQSSSSPFAHLDQTIVAAIQTDILHRNLGVSWDDIVALDDAKRVLQEAAILPLILPEAFHGIREPWRAVLLYGPPGTGKTMLAKAVASQCQATFFNVSSSTLLSKYYGDSEKYVKVLFEMARATAPSVIFFDELDSLMSHRGSSAEHEASRRVKSELLRQMDGIHESESDKDKTVVILATTNKPWDLDEAVRRRLEKRVYIPLPSSVARAALFVKYLSSVVDEQLNWEDLAARTDGYSCADIRLICRDAAMMPMRRLVQGKSVDDIKHMREGQANMKISLTMEDVLEAIKNVQPSWSQKDLQLYQTWSAQYGSV